MARTTPTYRCAMCCGEFEFSPDSEWSDADARAEAAINFPDLDCDTAERVCDECFRAMTALVPLPLGP